MQTHEDTVSPAPVNERQLRLMFDELPMGVYFVDRNQRHRFVNRSAATFFGSTVEDLLGKSVDEIFGREIIETLQEPARAVLRGETVNWEGWLSVPERGDRYVRLVFSPHVNTEGDVDGFYAFVRDATDLKQAEDERHRLTQLMQHAIESVPNGFAVYDEENRLITCNTAYSAPCGASPDELAGLHARDILRRFAPFVKSAAGRPVADPESWVDFVLESQARASGPREIELKTGQWLMQSCHKTDDDRLVIVRTDITVLKQAESTLRESEALKAAIISSAFDCIVTANEASEIIEFNPAAERVFGYARADVIGGKVGDVIVPPHLREAHDAGIKRYLETGQAKVLGSRIEVEGMRSDGTCFPIEISVSEVDFDKGRAFATFIRDISERKAMEQDLRNSEQRFRSIAGAHPVPVTIVTIEDGEILYASQPWAEQFGLSVEVAPGRSAEDFYVDTDDRRRFLDVMRRDGFASAFEVQMKKADGTPFWASLTSKRITFEGRDAVVTGIFDLTGHRTAEAEIARQRDALHQSEKLSALGSLLAGVAHELNNPLSVVVGQSLMLAEEITDPGAKHRTAKIRDAAERCARIVRTFLDMARQREPVHGPVRLDAIVDTVLEAAGSTLQSSEIQVVNEVSPDLPEIQADTDQLQQLLTNLVLNSHHALYNTDGPRRIVIRAEVGETGDQVRMAVVDNGPGLSADARARVFEPLYTTKSSGEGTGVGLTVCRAIVEAHSGTIHAEDTPGGGATFVVRLPLVPNGRPQSKPPHDAAPVGPAATHAARDGEGQAIPSLLVVEDETDIAEMLSEILARDGYRIHVARSGHDAIRQLRRSDFDIILSDVRMADGDGRDLYRWMRDERPALLGGLIFMTGDTLGSGADDFLASTGRPVVEKPLLPTDVRQIVANVLADGASNANAS